MKRITVFGGSKPKPGEPAYSQALHLGSILGASGYMVQTGGYIGTMEAVSRGAAQAGGHVIGITCEEIEAWRSIRRNPWVQEEIRFEKLRDRLYALVVDNDAALALPGGPGTLTEIATMWNLLLVNAIPARPLILIGHEWKATFERFFQVLADYIPQEQRRWLSFVPDEDSAMSILKQQVPV
jgi:uncharacterized protein (TIGR00725 family)